jgi:uncharacterized membrane protein
VTRRNAVVLSVLAAIVAGLLLLYAISQTTLSFLVPSPKGIIQRTAIFRPALIASIVNGVVLLASIGGIIWAAVSRPLRWWWWVLPARLVVGAIADVVVLTSSRPLF